MSASGIILGLSEDEENAQVIALNRYRGYSFIAMLVVMLALSLYFIFTQGTLSPLVLPVDLVLLSVFGVMLCIVVLRFGFNYAEIHSYDGAFRRDAYSRFFTRSIGWSIVAITMLALVLYPVYTPSFYKGDQFFSHKLDTATPSEPIEITVPSSDSTRLIVPDRIFIEVYEGADVYVELWKKADVHNSTKSPLMTANVTESKEIMLRDYEGATPADHVLIVRTKGASSEVATDIYKVLNPLFYYITLFYSIAFVALSIFWSYKTRTGGRAEEGIVEIPKQEAPPQALQMPPVQARDVQPNDQGIDYIQTASSAQQEPQNARASETIVESGKDRLFGSGISLGPEVKHDDLRHTEPERHVDDERARPERMRVEGEPEQNMRAADSERLQVERELREKLAREEMKRRELEKMLQAKEESVIEDIFLIHTDGRLICHNTRRLKPELDGDILTGMLTAVQSFVKDTLNTQTRGNLNELKYGELNILIEYGQYAYIAVVISGAPPRTLRPRMKELLKILHVKYYHTLPQWDGNVAKVRDAKEILKALFTGVLPRELITQEVVDTVEQGLGEHAPWNEEGDAQPIPKVTTVEEPEPVGETKAKLEQPPTQEGKSVVCPSCGVTFPVLGSQRPIQITCPSCGISGTLR